jgi:hypothetical protein
MKATGRLLLRDRASFCSTIHLILVLVWTVSCAATPLLPDTTMGESRCKGAFIEWPVLAPAYVFSVMRDGFLQENGEPLSEVVGRLQSYLASIRRPQGRP